MVYTITLNPAIDYVMQVEKLEVGNINRSDSNAVYYGGKGINVSAVLSRLGTDNKALGFIAGFTGKELEKMLKSDGINSDFVYSENGYTRINVKLRADSETDINAYSSGIDDYDIDALIKKLDCIDENDFVVLAGSLPDNMPADVYDKIIKKVTKAGAQFAVDTTGDLLKSTLKYKPFLIKPNHIELGDLFDTVTENENDIVFYAKKLQELGAKNVLVSWAENGAILVDENAQVHMIEAVKGELVNSVGCGDSMLAGFIAGFIDKHDYDYALKLGTACGSATAFSPQLATKEEIERILNSEFASKKYIM